MKEEWKRSGVKEEWSEKGVEWKRSGVKEEWSERGVE